MKISLSMATAYEFACHSKVCAPPPAGRGGSTKGSVRHQNRNKPVPQDVEQHNGQWYPVVGGKRQGFGHHDKATAVTSSRHANYIREMVANRKNTTVTRDGKIAVTNGGGRMPRFKTKTNKV